MCVLALTRALLPCFAQAFSSWGSGDYSWSLCAGYPCGVQAQGTGISSPGTRALVAPGHVESSPTPGIKPMSPELAGGFLNPLHLQGGPLSSHKKFTFLGEGELTCLLLFICSPGDNWSKIHIVLPHFEWGCFKYC